MRAWHGMAYAMAWRGWAWCSMVACAGPWRGMAWRPRHGRVVAGDALSQTNLLRGGALAASDGVLKHPRAPPPRARRKAPRGWVVVVVPAAAACGNRSRRRCPHGRGQATHGVGMRAREGYSSWWRGEARGNASRQVQVQRKWVGPFSTSCEEVERRAREGGVTTARRQGRRRVRLTTRAGGQSVAWSGRLAVSARRAQRMWQGATAQRS